MISTRIKRPIFRKADENALKLNRGGYADPMTYYPDMDQIDSTLLEQVVEQMNNYNPDDYTARDVQNALAKDDGHLNVHDFGALLSNAAGDFLEEIAQKAQTVTRTHFGNSIGLFTPLYIANHCEAQCTYCGFNCYNKIKRAKLTEAQIEVEMQEIAKTGLQELLILTGEIQSKAYVEYIGAACKLAKKYFRIVAVEVFPMNVEDYEFLHSCGADFVTCFQETYQLPMYEKVHPGGRKRVFPYRFYTQERALMGGMRGVSFGALLGLSDYHKDAFAVGLHASLIQKKYPSAEIAISCPRLRPIVGQPDVEKLGENTVSDKEFFKIICAYRLFLPFCGITISTRESEEFRDNIVKIAATKVSAGVNTGIGGHSEDEEQKGDEQFEIDDDRTVNQVKTMLKSKGLQPVMAEYVFV
ncbi:thiamine biosynthesis protein ThiH [Actinomycetota bacterium]|nr:thiamine biosynthesis protein ThiH [Actinomycetota bacterium]